VADSEQPLQILIATPAYWPGTAFGGPIQVFRSLVGGLTAMGHHVDVVTSSLVELGSAGARSSTMEELDGARIHRAATPLRFRWMGITPTLPLLLRGLDRPDVAHVFGFRDPVGTLAARWCRRNNVPYVFEALGMFAPKLRKIRLKRLLDSTLFRGVSDGAHLHVAASSREADEYRAAGVSPESIVVRPNGFPDPIEAVPRPGRLRRLIGVDAETPLVLSVGRIARGKGLEILLDAARDLPRDVHVAIVGPDDRHGMVADLKRLRDAWGLGDRVHLVGPLAPAPLLDVYSEADVFVLASAHENFGLVAAEAAAAGTASVVTDRTGVAELLADRAAIVVPYDVAEVRAAIQRLLGDAGLRRRLGAGGRLVAAEHSWPTVVAQQEAIYRRVLRA
jgi:glycosyltransferase involved in cell wall biosynthesis